MVLNPTTYVADSAMLDSICFTDFTLMKDYPCFVESFSRYMQFQESDSFQIVFPSGQAVSGLDGPRLCLTAAFAAALVAPIP